MGVWVPNAYGNDMQMRLCIIKRFVCYPFIVTFRRRRVGNKACAFNIPPSEIWAESGLRKGCYLFLNVYIHTVSHRSEYTPHIFVNMLLYNFM